MVKSARTQNARLNQLRAQQRAAEKRRRLVIAVAAIGAVVVVVAALVLAAVLRPQPQSAASGPLDASVYTTLSTIPASTFDTVGAGKGVSNPPKTISAPALTRDGKPRVLYVGAEYCPFCAAERWPVVVALTRFGTFTGLSATTSGAAPEAYPDTSTLTFHGASYSSDVVGFTGIETQTNTQQPLDTLTGDDKTVFDTYNAGGGIPFVDYGGKATSNGASFDVGLLAGKSQAEIATAIADPSTEIGQAVIGSANVITARVCQMTGNQPAAVCQSPGVTAVAADVR